MTPLQYPPTRQSDQVDHYHGTAIADPFRWLEDDRAPETTAWVEAQNRVTFGYLDAIPWRNALRDRMTVLVNYPRFSAPRRKKHWTLFAKNDGLQNQAAYYLQHADAESAELLLDPNTMSADGTTQVGGLTFDGDGEHIAYTVSLAGSDWQEIRVIHLKTRTQLPDIVEWVKVSAIAWAGAGFFYSRYPEPSSDDSAFSTKNEDHQVFFHALGTPQSADRLVYRDQSNPQRFHILSTTEDERFAILSISDRGQGHDGNALHLMDLTAPERGFLPVWTSFEDQMDVLDNEGDSLLVLTNRHAPNQRLVRIDPQHPEEAAWTTIVPERAEPISGMSTGGQQLFVTYMQDVITRAFVHQRDGTGAREIALPGLGTAVGFDGEHDATSVFYTFTSFTAPPTIFEFDIATGGSRQSRDVTLPFDPSGFETTQIFATSADGTRIPAFVVGKKGLVLDGNNPTMLYGYGGFNVSLPPSFSALRMAFLEQGGVYVQANLRGGGEYGEQWHQAGMKARKQNVFDDFIAVAEWLIEHRYTRSEKLAIAGGSNGGLLVGAIMTQRPQLARVALPSVGVMDMLRFHKFTIGWNWIADYGSSDDPDAFTYLAAYSPLHNLRNGVSYPATMITTADHDDRVVPAHSFKFAARLQQAHAGSTPVLIRIETQSGHGSSSLTKQIAAVADDYAFLLHELGAAVSFPPLEKVMTGAS